MSNLIYDYVIIGTGLAAIGIIYKLSKKKNKKILIVESENQKLIKNFKNPIYCDEKIPIPISNNIFKNKPFLELLKYKTFGGNSNYWGGYCCRFDQNDLKKWPIDIIQLSKYYNEADNILKINSKFKRNKISKKFFVTNSIISKKKNKVFNTIHLIEKIIKNKNINIKFDELIKFKKKGDFYYLFSKKNKKIVCKKVFLCAGVYGTQEILKKSIDGLNFKKIEQAQSYIIPVFSKKKFIKKKIDKQIFFMSKKKFGNLYFEFKKNDNLLNKTLKKNMNYFYKFFPRFIFERIGVIWGFIPSTYSYNYKIENKKILISYKDKKKKRETLEYIDLVCKILKEKLNFIVFKKLIKLNQFARSYHVGSNIPMSNKRKIYITTKIDGSVNIPKYKNLYINGSSIFPSLPSKSHGLTILANGLRIAENFKND